MEYIGLAYKYRSFGLFDDEVKSRINESLVEYKCYFSKPKDLNDPLEYRPRIIIDKKKSKEYFKNEFKQYGYNVTDEKLSDVVNKESENMMDSNKFNKIINEYAGIFCMSKSSVLNTQWAYYGGDHAGYCIEYLIDKNFGFARDEVNYICNRPVVEFPKFYMDKNYRISKLHEVNFSKSDEWRLEEEVRVVREKSGLFQIEKESITGVIFGYRCKDEHKEYMIDLISHAPHIKIYECKFNEVSYTFDKVPIQV